MPGTFVIDSGRSFAAAFLMASAPKPKFGAPSEQEHSADGTPKWVAQVAVTFIPQGTMAPVSEVLTVTVTCPRNPGEDIPAGSPVVFDDLRVGVSAPEKRDNGTIRGGRLWYSAAGLRPASASLRNVKAEAS